LAQYNGHRNWNHWNVALWLFNDEALYSLVTDTLRKVKGKKAQAETLLAALPAMTPDGAPYSVASIMAALKK
jgi:hypothetical protein